MTQQAYDIYPLIVSFTTTKHREQKPSRIFREAYFFEIDERDSAVQTYSKIGFTINFTGPRVTIKGKASAVVFATRLKRIIDEANHIGSLKTRSLDRLLETTPRT